MEQILKNQYLNKFVNQKNFFKEGGVFKKRFSKYNFRKTIIFEKDIR